MKVKQWATTKVQELTLTQAVPVTVLTNLLMLTSDPVVVGFDEVGGGCYGTVFRHDLTPGVVYKVAHGTYSQTVPCIGLKFNEHRAPTEFYRTCSDGFAAWATLCVNYQAEFGDMPFLPKFYKVQHSHAHSVYAMEGLDSCGSTDDGEWQDEDDREAARSAARGFADYLDVEHDFGDDAWVFDDHIVGELNHFCAWLHRQLPDDFDSWDIHSGNVMLRGDCPVLTDPWSGIHPYNQPVSLTRRLSVSLGASA